MLTLSMVRPRKLREKPGINPLALQRRRTLPENYISPRQILTPPKLGAAPLFRQPAHIVLSTSWTSKPHPLPRLNKTLCFLRVVLARQQTSLPRPSASLLNLGIPQCNTRKLVNRLIAQLNPLVLVAAAPVFLYDDKSVVAIVTETRRPPTTSTPTYQNEKRNHS